jgi:hypothetical protein
MPKSFVLPPEVRTKKYSRLGAEISKSTKSIQKVQKVIDGGGTLTFAQVEALNTDLSRLLARASNAAWE